MSLIPLGFFGGGSSASLELISTQVLASAATSVTFSSIPQTYKHLQLRYAAYATNVGLTAVTINLNGDNASNYAQHSLDGDGASVSSFNSSSRINFNSPYIYSNANSLGAGILDFLDYTSTTKNKTMRGFGGLVSGQSHINLVSGLWMSTAAISSIVLTTNGQFATTSRFSLYGVKG